MITKAEVTRTVSERIQVYRCTVCGTEFENNDYGESAAREHANTHAPLIYLHPGHRWSDTVWIDEGALLKQEGSRQTEHYIQHANQGRTFVEWQGPGWYVLHEYTKHYQNDSRDYKKFIHVDSAKEKLKEKFDALKQDWRQYIDLRKRGRPS